MTTPLRIGLAGIGTVGTGVVRIVQENAGLLAARAGREIAVAAVSARTRHRNRGVDLSAYAWEDDPVALARRDDVDLVVEVIGGENGPARAVTETALAMGKHVVTANKAMLAHHGQSLAELAESRDVSLRFEAAVAGGIPIIKGLAEGLAGNRIRRVMGVLNGTCNYILTRMEATGEGYDTVLEQAQKFGYAEADPSFDVDGVDAAHKLALLAATAFGTRVDFENAKIEGISHLHLADIEQARDMGYAIKLLGIARLNEDGLEQRTQPCLVPARSPLGQLEGVTNMVIVEGDRVGQTVFAGPGAGEGPTASAVIGDIIDIARGVRFPVFGSPATGLVRAGRSQTGVDAAYYLRFLLTDAPGVMGRITTALGRHGISIDRMRQYGHATDEAPVIIVTHKTSRPVLDAALAEISKTEASRAKPVAIRIEDV
ncbi:MAG: homoserine dehydrogenase [Paracoccaceae bacterium]